jgi:hypothetical protein
VCWIRVKIYQKNVFLYSHYLLSLLLQARLRIFPCPLRRGRRKKRRKRVLPLE